MTDQPSLAWIVSTLRKLRGVTLHELASSNGVERPNMSAWFAGREKVISRAKQQRLSEFVGWRFEQLSTGQVHIWTLEEAEDLALMLSFLSQTIKPTQQKLVLMPTLISNALAGFRLFVVTQHGDFALVLVRRAYYHLQLDAAAIIQALGFGELASSRKIGEEEYEALWREASPVISVDDYLQRFLAEPAAGALDGGASAVEGGETMPGDQTLAFLWHRPPSPASASASASAPHANPDSRYPGDGLEDEPLMPPHALSEEHRPHISRPDDEAISIFNYDAKWERLMWACNKAGITSEEVQRMIEQATGRKL